MAQTRSIPAAHIQIGDELYIDGKIQLVEVKTFMETGITFTTDIKKYRKDFKDIVELFLY